MALCLVYWIEFFWGQVAINLFATVLMVILLQWSKPLATDFANNMETFNEVITLLVLYLLMCFSDFIVDPVVRDKCGKVYIAILIFYALVHIVLLFQDVCSKLVYKLRKIYYAKRNKGILAKRATKKAMYQEAHN